MGKMIPVNAPLIGGKELKYVENCVKSGWISSKGEYIERFEREFADFCGMKYGVSATSGTAALHLALSSLGVTKGDEVIIPTFTMIATAYAVLYTGAKPVFVDCENETWNMDPAKVEKLITKKTKAILPVHIYGHPVDMDPILKLAKKYGLLVIEDAAEAHGAEYKGKRCGAFGDINCFSFYANKIITTGEGGMVVTDNKRYAEKARLLKDLAHSPKKRFLHTELAYNYRMTNMQAALGLAQLGEAGNFIKKKRHIADLYYDNLKNVAGLRLPVEKDWAKSVYWMYAVLIEKEFGPSREEVMKRLLEEGVETRSFFVPMHRQPIIKKLNILDKGKKYPIADYISEKGFYLPTGLSLGDDDVLYVCKKLKEIQKQCRKRHLP